VGGDSKARDVLGKNFHGEIKSIIIIESEESQPLSHKRPVRAFQKRGDNKKPTSEKGSAATEDKPGS